MPGAPKVGDRYHQEVAPKVAMDRFEIASVTETVDAPAGKFVNCVRTLARVTAEDVKALDELTYRPRD